MMTSILGPTALGAGLLLMAHLPSQETDRVRVCVGPDRVLRQQAGGRCQQPMEREYLLAAVEPVFGEANPDQGERPAGVNQAVAQIADLQQRVAALTQRIAMLERTPSQPAGDRQRTARPGQRVVAPFQVVDAAGKPIFEVNAKPRGFNLQTASGHYVAFAAALDNGGFFKATSADNDVQSVIGVDGKVSVLRLRTGGNDGTVLAQLAIGEDGKASLNIANDDGISVVALEPGASGGGRLQLGDAAGNAMVEAGVTASGLGLVRAYPMGSPGAGLVGMPGTFIMGRSGR